MKKYALEMKNKILLSNQQCNEIDDKYFKSTSLLTQTMQKLREVFSSNSNYWCYLFLFLILIFLFLYKITK
jgi:hypothetical protein